MTNKRKNVLYVGVTSHLEGRVMQHKSGEVKGFTSKYIVNQWVYYEEFEYIYDAIAREKQLKNWKHRWKEELISRNNPYWDDLSLEWYD